MRSAGMLALALGLALACAGGAPPRAEEAIESIAVQGRWEVGGPFVEVALGADGCVLDTQGEVHCFSGLGARNFASKGHERRTLPGSYRSVAAGMPFVGGIDTTGALVGHWRPGVQRLEGDFEVARFGAGGACGLEDGQLRCLEGEGARAPEVSVPLVDFAMEGEGGCGLEASGDAHCWGPWQDVLAGRYARIDVGTSWACGVDAAGWPTCVGDGAAAVDRRFVDLAVAAEGSGACGVESDGGITCWTETLRYRVLDAKDDFVGVDIGTSAVCGLRKSTAGLVCWPLRQRL